MQIEEYQKKLLSSIKEENDEYYSRLRHDLINYIETKQYRPVLYWKI